MAKLALLSLLFASYIVVLGQVAAAAQKLKVLPCCSTTSRPWDYMISLQHFELFQAPKNDSTGGANNSIGRGIV